MIHRVVRMTLHHEHVNAFMELFERVHGTIEAQPGCLGVSLWSDTKWPNIVTTYSHWESEGALDAYRQTPFFKETWGTTRRFFAARPEAASYEQVFPTG